MYLLGAVSFATGAVFFIWANLVFISLVVQLNDRLAEGEGFFPTPWTLMKYFRIREVYRTVFPGDSRLRDNALAIAAGAVLMGIGLVILVSHGHAK